MRKKQQRNKSLTQRDLRVKYHKMSVACSYGVVGFNRNGQPESLRMNGRNQVSREARKANVHA